MTAFTKSRRIIALLVAILMICAPILSMPVQTFAAAAASYFVDGTNGNDANDGSLAAPFKTIQKAATMAASGDTVEIRTGVYRETVTPASDNVTFKNYGGEKVIMSGGDLVTGWTSSAAGANIYEAPMSWDFDNGNGNIVFYTDAAGKPVSMSQARWPNIKDSEMFIKTKYAKFTTDPTGPVGTPDGRYMTYSNKSVTGNLPVTTTDAWKGALLVSSVANGFTVYTGEVTASSTSLTFKWPYTSGYFPKSASPGFGFYLTNSLTALQRIALAPTANTAAWYKDVTAGKLYMVLTDGSNVVVDPSGGAVEAKKRAYVFNLDGRSGITIQGIDVRAAGINFANSHDNTLKGAVIEKVDSYNRLFDTSIITDGLVSGFTLDGYNNTVRDSEIKDMFGAGIIMKGHDNKVINNHIHDVDRYGVYADGVTIYGYNQLVSHNTIHATGRSAIGGKFSSSVIQYNDMYDAMKISYDGGVFYVVNHDFGGSEVHHNTVHDTPNGEGIYFDNVSNNAMIYNNIVWNTSVGFLINTPSERMVVVNNTAYNNATAYSSWGDANDTLGNYGTVIMGNIFTGAFNSQVSGGATEKLNVLGTVANIGSMFVDAANFNFALANPAGYRSAEIAGVTDGHTSASAVPGAVQPGVTWKAGYDFANAATINPTFQIHDIPYRQLVKNGGFVDALNNWTATPAADSPEVIKHNAWDYRAKNGGLIKDGFTGVVLENGEKISQTILVKPNTRYNASVWGKVMGHYVFAGDMETSSIPVNPVSYRATDGYLITGADTTLKFKDVEFAPGVDKVYFGTSSVSTTGKIDMYIGDPAAGGVLIATDPFSDDASSGGWSYKTAIGVTNPLGAGTYDVYLKFTNTNTTTPRNAFFSDFVLFDSTPDSTTDFIEFGVEGLSGGSVKKEYSSMIYGPAGAGARPINVTFTTGPNDTSVTIYAAQNGNGGKLRGYVDEFGLTETVFPSYPAPYTYKDGFEDTTWNPLNWVWGFGSPALDTTQKSEGTHSYKLDGSGDQSAIYKILETSYSKVATVDFYDDMAPTKSLVAHVDNSGAGGLAALGNMYGMGVHTDNSAQYYSYTMGTGAWATSRVARTSGWHKLTFDYSSGTGVDLYMDQTWIGYSNKASSFNTIALGDFFTGGNSSGNFDNVTVVDTTTLTAPLDFTVPNNLTVGTIGISVTSAAVTFIPNIRGGNNPQVTMSVTNANGTTSTFTSGMSLPVGLYTVTCTVTDGATVITKRFFLNVIQTHLFENFENIKANTSVSPSKLGNWTTADTAAVPDTSTANSYDGYQSFASKGASTAANNANKNGLVQTLSGWNLLNKVVSGWFYDSNPDATQINQALQLKSNTATPMNSWFLAQFKDATQNVGNQYAKRAPSTGTGGNKFVQSGVTRSLGWHQFKFDLTETGKLKEYIDGTLVHTESLTTESPDFIAFGGLWGNALSDVLTTYWDNVAVTNSIDTMGPVITPSGNTTTYYADTTGVVVDNAITFKDMDTTAIPNSAKVMVSIMDGLKETEDVLQLTNAPSSMGDIAGSYDATAGILTLSSASGATAAQWQAALQAVQYKNNVAPPSVAPRALSFVGYDGINLGKAVAKTVAISLNKLPIVSNTTRTATVNTAVYFTAANFGFHDLDGDALSSVKILTLPTHGTLTLSGTAIVADQVILASDFANFTYTPATDYVGADVFTWNGFDGNRFANTGAEIHVNVTEVPPNVYTIMATASIGGVIIGDVTVTEGTYATFTFIPDSGYLIDALTVDGVSETVTGNTYTFTNVTSNHTIHVTFIPAPLTSHTITASAGSNGLISPSGSVNVDNGADRTFSFTPNSGYLIDTLMVDATNVTVTSNTYTFVGVTSNHTIHVSFKQEPNNGSGGYIPPVPKPDGTVIVDPGQLAKSENGRTTLEIPANTTGIKLPGNTADLIQRNNLEIKSDALTLSIPSDVLKQLTRTLSADELKGGTISLKMNPLSIADAKELINKSSQSANTVNKLFGDVFEFNLSIQTADGKTINLSKFDKPIKLEFKVSPSMNPKLAGIYYLANDGKLEYVGGKVNNGVISAEINHFSKYALLEVTKTFTDVPSGHWASNVIKELAAKQILTGTSATTFEPGRSVTRAEFTVLLVRALKLTEKGGMTFTDVKLGEWYADAVSIAVKAGIVQGKSATLFDANAQITREEMVTLLLRAYEYKNGKAVSTATHSFSDVDQVSPWAVEFVKTALSLNLIQGRSADKFDPQGITTRAEAAQVLYNLLVATQAIE
ncbi:DUF1565 domain-containing protein [Paenibacillus sp. LMG 31461]|uniref:DUF1565 domain-containing protein n=1 Tax=Paenibacillus plantarum TaxID=2654975 RepID=A0ABX1X6S9_9BACL|nr:S-layer homology domain-containing protein [Paenibacillus plantarum]NOU63921.1 DUF1565 domain-containing protein [Paenibacillus plantarum]